MNELNKLHTRYLKNFVPIRLGGLAANLARIASFSKNVNHHNLVLTILQESKRFIEWTATELDATVMGALAELQVQLARWEIQSQQKWNDQIWCIEIADHSKEWSRRRLEMSGLLNSY